MYPLNTPERWLSTPKRISNTDRDANKQYNTSIRITHSPEWDEIQTRKDSFPSHPEVYLGDSFQRTRGRATDQMSTHNIV